LVLSRGYPQIALDYQHERSVSRTTMGVLLT
jgi:hypothetical protein